MVFAQRFFRQLFARLRTPSAVVLDNYQTLAAGARLHDVLARAIENVPAGVRLIVISREPPPPAFARPLANRAVSMIDCGDLRLLEREARGLLSRLGRGRLSPVETNRAVEMANGWAGGLVLLGTPTSHQRIRLPRPDTGERAPQEVFDYFAA
jgi:ATP/maltotriose-dependent transcriptional regulator MalT